MEREVKSRFAPSPTGYMHVGNLRTALYEYLIAKHSNGKFILRIEDTDQKRFVPGAMEVIYNTLDKCGFTEDEGPRKGGPNGPYIQSERKDIYKKYAEELVAKGGAYYCFCTEDRLEEVKKTHPEGYDRHCRNLSKEEIEKNLKAGMPYCIRQKVRLGEKVNYHDTVFGDMEFDSDTLQDLVLLKTDGLPTYNFANVVDDHLMGITHVVRGCEYLTSTPNFVQLYESFGWEVPIFVHLPLIYGKNEDGSTSKLSKRNGSKSFAELLEEGYLPEAILNFIALLGWHPASNEEFFTLDQLINEFSIDRINHSPAVFDYDKLNWMNAKYIRDMSPVELQKIVNLSFSNQEVKVEKLLSLVQPRVEKLTQIKEKVEFIENLPNFELALFENAKNKIDLALAKEFLIKSKEMLEKISDWTNDVLFQSFVELGGELGVKHAGLLYVCRIAISGLAVTPGGATEIMEIIGKDESLKRIDKALARL